MKRFFDLETHKIVTEDELRAIYEEQKREGGLEDETFADYLTNCTTGNGVLIRIIENEVEVMK